MNRLQRLLVVLLILLVPVAAAAATRLPRSTPEAQGVSSEALLEFVEAVDAEIDTMNSFMLVRHGHVVAEAWWSPFQASDPHMVYSVAKSFVSTAVGLAIAEGKLSLDDPVLRFFSDDAPADPDDNLQRMRVRDLLTMTTGHDAKVITDFPYLTGKALTRRFLSWPVAHGPGTAFVYNSPATYMLSAIVQKVSGETMLDYLRPRLFEPLGITDPQWDQSLEGVTIGASLLSLRTEDLACFGQLYLQEGAWQGRQLISAEWIKEATAKQVSNGSDPTSDSEQGYGYQFWRTRPGFARADGAYGQFCFIMPQYDAVLAITSGARDTKRSKDLVWDRILPAFSPGPLPANDEGHAALQQRIASLVVHSPVVAATSPRAERFSGRTYVFPANDRRLASITLRVANGETSLIVRGEGYDAQPIVVGHGAWRRDGTTRFGSDIDSRERILVDRPVAAIGGWTTPDTFVARLSYVETPYLLDVKLQFGGDLVVFNAEYNVAFGNATAYPRLLGRTE